MTFAPDVSLIMANYNGASHLGAAIRSAIGQTLQSWELIVVDDASTDDSIFVAQQAAGGDARVRIVAQTQNRGPAAARNRALEMAEGKWIAIFDSDDIMLPPRLEALLHRANADAAIVVADNLLLFSETSPPRPFLTNRLSRAPSWIDLAAYIESNCLYSEHPDLGCLKPMIRADVARQPMSRYDETLRIGEDYNFIVRLLAQGHRLRIDPACFYLYRKHAGSLSHRSSAGDIGALLEAEDRFSQRGDDLGPRVVAALGRRRRSLQSLLIYDAVIMAIKAGAPLKAACLTLPNPRMWPLLARPVAARFERLAAKARSARHVRPLSSAEAKPEMSRSERLTPDFVGTSK